jgi:hypothetical protein
VSKRLKLTFLIHAVVGVLLGLPLFIIPGRLLQWLGWAPIDPIISRLLGAALLALAWSSFRGWQAAERAQIAILIEMEVALTVLGCVGLLRHLLFSRYPAIVWVVFVLLALFAVAWIVSLVSRPDRRAA